MVIEKEAETYVPIHIERMQSEDAETVAELDEKCFPTPWSVGAFLNEVNNPSAYYVVARAKGSIVGYAGMWLIMDEAHITTFGVDPEFRRKKIAERMLVHLLDEAIHRGIRRITLEVRRHNQAAQNLYGKYRFHVVAIRKGYYTNNNEDAFVMWVDDLWNTDFLKTLRIQKEKLGQQA